MNEDGSLDQETAYNTNRTRCASLDTFVFLRSADGSPLAAFERGVAQLCRELLVQSFTIPGESRDRIILAAAGPLQLPVLLDRLQKEHGAAAVAEAAPWRLARWVPEQARAEAPHWRLPPSAEVVKDAAGADVLLFETEGQMRFFERHYLLVPLLTWEQRIAR